MVGLVRACCLLLLQVGVRSEDGRCYKGGEAARTIRDWISSSMESCRAGGDCEVSQHRDILLTRLGPWYVTSGWTVSSEIRKPRVEAYQGVFYYGASADAGDAGDGEGGEGGSGDGGDGGRGDGGSGEGGDGEGGSGEGGSGEGVYIYPDWTHCVQGRWRRHLLEEGQYCTLTEVCLSDSNTLTVSTRVTLNTKLTYSPPSLTSFGVPPTLMDPFENTSVVVRASHIKGSHEGLFTIRDIHKGELISFYSGFLNNCDNLETSLMMMKMTMKMTNAEIMERQMWVVFRGDTQY